MVKRHPIGIFDSGVGGLSVAEKIKKQMPFEFIHYFADSTNCPYGSRSPEETFSLARRNIEFLLELDCKLIVIACNTVTAVAIEQFRKEYHIPFIGMEPAIKPAALNTKTRKIGVLATKNTFLGGHFKKTFEKYGQDVEVIQQEGAGLVELVENGDQDSETAEKLLKDYLQPMLEKGVDTIVLGCTHYPFLKKMIEKITCGRVRIVDPSDAVARQTRRVLERLDILSDATADAEFNFFTTGKTQTAEKMLAITMPPPFHIRQINPNAA